MDSRYRPQAKVPSTLVYSACVGANGEYKQVRSGRLRWPDRTRLALSTAQKQALTHKEN